MVEHERETPPEASANDQRFRSQVVHKEQRKLRARREADRGPWFWLGMFGLVGWSVAIPTLVGVFIGLWLDGLSGGRISWTLTMLFVGAVVGCITAWYWVQRESRRR
jgi:ATP synthase protein I